MSAIRLSVILVVSLLSVQTAFADGGVLYISPDRGEYLIGQSFEVKVVADTGGVSINAAEADLTFNPAAFSIEEISTNGSVLQMWPTPPQFSNDRGTIQFSGLTNHYFAGSDGLLITITFKALHTMPGGVQFVSGAMLASDGRESNIITSLKSGLFSVHPAESLPTAATTTPEVLGAASTSVSTSHDPRAPSFVEYSTDIRLGDRIIMKGVADPGTKVSVWLQRESDTPLQSDSASASDGSFTFTSETISNRGAYHVWAVARDDHGVQSATSKTIDVTVHSVSFAAVALADLSFVSRALPFFALVFFAGLGVGYALRRKKFRRMTSH